MHILANQLQFSRLQALLAVALVAFVARPVEGSDSNWPSFRGPGGSGVAAKSKLPETWNIQSGKNIAWKVELPGYGISSPVIWGEKIFVTSAVPTAKLADEPKITWEALAGGASMDSVPQEADMQWTVYCLERSTGKMLWNTIAASGRPRSLRHSLNSQATPTVATDGHRLLVMFGSEGLYCFDLEGKLIWKKDLGRLDIGSYQDTTLQWGYASSPILFRDTAIIQCDIDQDPYIAAFKLSDGSLVWRIARTDLQSWSTPAVLEKANPPQLVTLAPRYVRAYNAVTGDELWHLFWGMDIVESMPVTNGPLLYVASGKGPTAPILAIRPDSSGDISLRKTQTSNRAVTWSSAKGGPITTTPLYYEGLLYALSDFGFLRCYQAETGELIYEKRIAAAFQASPVAAHGKLYVPSLEGDMYVIRAGRDFQVVAVNPMGAMCQATPAISGDLLIVRTRQAIFGIRNIPAAEHLSSVNSK